MRRSWAKVSCLAASGLLLLGIASAATRKGSQPEPMRGTKIQKGKGTVPVRELRGGRVVRFSAPPPQILQEGIACGPNGDISLVYGASPRAVLDSPNGATPLPVRKISIESQNVMSFTLQSLQGYQRFDRKLFNVNARGTVYVLYTAFRQVLGRELREHPEYVIVKFHNDGTVDSTVRLQEPPAGRLTPMSFGAFADGQLLVSGLVTPAAGLRDQPRPFTGIFDTSGNYEQEIKLFYDTGQRVPLAGLKRGGATVPGHGPAGTQGNRHGARGKLTGKTASASTWEEAVGQSRVLDGPANTLDLLLPTNPAKLYAVSSDGRVLHDIAIKPPKPGLQLVEASPAGPSRLLVEFAGPASKKYGFKGSVILTFALVSLEDGKTVEAYRLPRGANYLPGCANGPSTFEFLGTTKGHKLKVVIFHGN